MRYKEGTFHEMAAKNVYYAPIVLGLGVLLVSGVPEWSLRYGIVSGIVFLLTTIWLIIGRIYKLHLNIRWHAFTMILIFNLFSIACLIPFWRLLDEPIWLLKLLAGLYIICFFLTYKYRHTVAKGIYATEGRKTPFGKIYWRTAFVSILLSGGGSYGNTRRMQETLGYNETLMFIAVAILPLAFLTMIAIQGLWTRVKDPAYNFDED